jgi:serine/threonine protein kinase
MDNMESKAAKDEKPISPDDAPKIIYLTDEARAEKIVKCPYCGEETAVGAERCDHCSRLLPIAENADEKPVGNRPVNFDSLGYIKSALASKYEVVEEIARTETSIVFLAISLQLKREVALKVLLKRAAQDHDFVERFHRRTRAVDRLSQSNVITIFDEGVESGIHYMAMEFLKGVDLQKKIAEDGPVSPDELVNIMMPATSALGHAHSNGILHGNIKSSSIFLHNDGRIILFSFGIPYLAKGNQLSFKRDPNSVEYLSPEEASSRNVDGRSDIYSLGVVMYYSLTGRYPYTGLTSAATIDAILNGHYVPVNRLRQIPEWLEKTIDKCLERDISKRMQSCAELLGRLNVRPVAPGTQVGQSEGTGSDLPDVEPIRGRSVEDQHKQPGHPIFSLEDISHLSDEELSRVIEPGIDESPTDEKPVQAQRPEESQITKPRLREDLPPQYAAIAEVGVKSGVLPEKPPRVAIHAEEREASKSKGGIRRSILVTIVAAILLTAVAVLVMIRNLGEPVPPGQGTNRVQTPQENGAQPAGNQEDVSRPIQPPVESASRAESSTDHAQGESSSNATSSPPARKSPPNNQKVSSGERRPIVPRTSSQPASSREKSVTSSSSGTVSEPPEQPVVVLVSVPNLIGTQLGAARSILSLNGLSVGAVSTIPDPANDGIVVRQIPKPGTQLKQGSTVNLILGSK